MYIAVMVKEKVEKKCGEPHREVCGIQRMKMNKEEERMTRVYFNETCGSCGSDDVITLHDSDGSYDHCNDCGSDSRN